MRSDIPALDSGILDTVPCACSGLTPMYGYGVAQRARLDAVLRLPRNNRTARSTQALVSAGRSPSRDKPSVTRSAPSSAPCLEALAL